MFDAVALLSSLGRAKPLRTQVLPWFPWVGAALGGAVGGVWWGANHLWFALIAAGLALLAEFCLTAGLPYVSVVRAADVVAGATARSAPAPSSRPAVAVGAAVVVTLVLLLRWSSLTVIASAPALLAALWCVSRGVVAVSVAIEFRSREVKTANPSPSDDAEDDNSAPKGKAYEAACFAALWTVVLAAPLIWLGGPAETAIAVAACVVVSTAGVVVVKRRLGSMNPSALMASGLMGETAGLLAAAASWQ